MIRYIGDSYAYNQCLSGSKHRTAWCRTAYPETPHPADFSAVDRYDDRCDHYYASAAWVCRRE